MALARRIELWDLKSVELTQRANIHRDKKKKRTPYKVKDIHPYAKQSMGRRRRRGIPLTDIKMLKAFLPQEKNK